MIPWVLASIVAVGALLATERLDSRPIRGAAKGIASALFVGAGITRGPQDAWDHAILFALVLSAVGDLLLVPRDKRAFLAGMGAFGVAHLGFAAAFWGVPPAPGATAGGAVAMAAVAIGAARVLLPRVRGAMRFALPAYLAVIGLMVALGIGAGAAGGPMTATVAAIAFAASDLAVARQRFVTESFVNRAVGLPLYYAAQLAFASTIG